MLDQVRAAIPDRDTAENTVHLVIDNGLQNAVTVFQRVVEALFSDLPSPPRARRNVFQSLGDGSALWKQATRRAYEDHLSVSDLETLGRAFQQRHLLAHRQGIVDAEYIAKSGDRRYRVGQRIVVRAESVTTALDLIEVLVGGLQADVASHRSQVSASP